MAEDGISASVITIGDELMIGQVIDTNSAWIAQQLNDYGIRLKRRVAVGDDREDILYALEEEQKHSQIILITGGLGPTEDDITKTVLNEYFGGRMVMNEEVLGNIRHIFEHILKRPLIDRNINQALVPDNCTVLFNHHGTAPGMWFEKKDRIIVSLPGVPNELKGLMTDTVLPKLAERFNTGFILHKTLITFGYGESFIAEHIQDFTNALPTHIKLAFLPNYGLLRLRLTGYGKEKDLIETELQSRFGELRERVKKWLVVDEDITMPALLGRILKEKKLSLSTAESCTGGYIAHLFTRNAGASDFFKGSVVSYSNKLKENMLGVRNETLKNYGAVSEETVREMAAGAIRVMDTDYVIATSGIMGPGGGRPDKPVGTVWIAVGSRSEIRTRLLQLRWNRITNIDHTANYALNQLRELIGEKQS